MQNKPHALKEMLTNDTVELLANMRGKGLSLPAILALQIVNENYSSAYPMVYPGEVESVYRSIVANKREGVVVNIFNSSYPDGILPWSYSAVCRMLRVLAKKGYLTRERSGRYVGYGMTIRGVKLLTSIFGESANKNPKFTK